MFQQFFSYMAKNIILVIPNWLSVQWFRYRSDWQFIAIVPGDEVQRQRSLYDKCLAPETILQSVMHYWKRENTFTFSIPFIQESWFTLKPSLNRLSIR